MTIRSGFFQSVGGDRRYRAEFFASYFSSFVGNGVFNNPSSSLQVVPTSGLGIEVLPGRGWINGYYLLNDSTAPFTLSQADGVASRIDRITMGLNFNTREVSIYVKQGNPSGNPVAPSLTRDANVYELGLADVRINAGLTAITAANITDTRLNSQLCGVVTALITQLDTTSAYNQYEQQFNDFLQSLVNALDGDTAGNLLNMINALRSDLNTHEALLASQSQLGHVRVGNNIAVDNGIISVPSGSTTNAGIVMLSNSLTSNSTTNALTSLGASNLNTRVNQLQSSSVLDTIAGSTQIFTETTEYSIQNAVFQPVASFVASNTGSIRVSYQVSSSSSGITAFSEIRVNGTSVFTGNSSSIANSFVNFNVDINFNAGDIIQFRLRSSNVNVMALLRYITFSVGQRALIKQ